MVPKQRTTASVAHPKVRWSISCWSVFVSEFLRDRMGHGTAGVIQEISNAIAAFLSL